MVKEGLASLSADVLWPTTGRAFSMSEGKEVAKQQPSTVHERRNRNIIRYRQLAETTNSGASIFARLKSRELDFGD